MWWRRYCLLQTFLPQSWHSSWRTSPTPCAVAMCCRRYCLEQSCLPHVSHTNFRAFPAPCAVVICCRKYCFELTFLPQASHSNVPRRLVTVWRAAVSRALRVVDWFRNWHCKDGIPSCNIQNVYCIMKQHFRTVRCKFYMYMQCSTVSYFSSYSWGLHFITAGHSTQCLCCSVSNELTSMLNDVMMPDDDITSHILKTYLITLLRRHGRDSYFCNCTNTCLWSELQRDDSACDWAIRIYEKLRTDLNANWIKLWSPFETQMVI